MDGQTQVQTGADDVTSLYAGLMGNNAAAAASLGNEADLLFGSKEPAPVVPPVPPVVAPQPAVPNPPAPPAALQTLSNEEKSAIIADISNLQKQVEANPEIQNTKEFQDKVAAYYKKAGIEPPAPAAPAATSEESVVPTEAEITNPFLKGLLVDKAEAQVEPIPQDQFNAFVQQKHSFDISTDEGRGKFLNTVNKWRSDSANLGDASSKLERLSTYIDTLPPELLLPIQAHSRGEDWKSALKGSSNTVSYDKSWTDLPDDQKRNFVKAQFPGDFQDGDLDDLKDKGLSQTLKAAEQIYGIKQQNVEIERNRLLESQKARVDKYNSMLGESVTKLKQDFPGFDNSQVSKIHDVLASNSLGNYLFDSNGMPKPETAKMVALMLYGEEAISQAVGVSSSKAVASVATQYANGQVSRPPTPAAASPGGAANKAGDANVQRQINELMGLIKAGSNPYDNIQAKP